MMRYDNFFNHDCPGMVIRKPVSYCTHAGRLYLWLGRHLRLRLRLWGTLGFELQRLTR